MINEPKIGLVTVLYNGIEVLQGFFESLAKQTYKNYILYVIDNSPNEDALNEAKRLADSYNIPAEFVYNNANLGVAKGNNQGIEKALYDGCTHVLLINNDVEFEEELMEKLIQGLNENNCEMIVPKMYYFDEPNKIWCAGGEFRKWYGYHTRHFGENETDKGQFDEIKKIDYAPTCCMLIKSEVFHKIGYMDEKYFVYSDDADFCYRALNQNVKLYYLPSGKLWHKVSTSTGGSQSDFSIFYANRNLLFFCFKNTLWWYHIYAIIFYQFKYFVKLLVGKFSISQYKLAQKAFFKSFFMNKK